MDFDLSEEQRLLKDSVDRLLADTYEFAKRKTYMAEPDGFSRALWAQYAELGLLGLPFAEEHGGFGGGPVETMLVMEAIGRVLALEPYLATVVLCGTALRLASRDEQKSGLLQQVAEGNLRLAWAHGERQARYDLTDVLTTAKNSGGGWRLDGGKSVVIHGDSADKLVVSARTAGDRNDPDGISLFVVDAGANGVARRSYKMRDGTRAAEISLSGVEAEIDRRGRGRARGRRARRRGRDRRDLGRGRRDDRRIPEDAPAVRPADRAQPGRCSTAPPRCSWQAGTGLQHGDARGDDG